MYALLSLFKSKQIYVIKGPLFSILKRSTSIHKNNPALVVSIVCKKKHYFHGICAFSKKNPVNFTRSCAFAQIAQLYALQVYFFLNLTHLKAAKLATLND